MRADAERNRTAILATARTLMADLGSSVAMGDIANRAGVAVGTLYRHFPTKADLVAAVVEDSVSAIADELESALQAVAGGEPPSRMLAATFRSQAERHSTDRALKDAARGAGVLVPSVEGLMSSPAAMRAQAALAALLAEAAAEGSLAAETTVADVMVLVDGVPPADLGAAQRERYVDVVLRGLMRREG